MKRLIAFALFVLCLSAVSNAQTDTEKCKVFSYSVRAGFNASTRIGDDMPSKNWYHWRHSFNVGVTCDIRKSKRFLGRTGVYYTEKGFNEEPGGQYTHLNYLEMPVLAVFQWKLARMVNFEMQVGMFFAYGVCGKMSWSVSDSVYVPESDVWDYDHFKTVGRPVFKDSEWGSASYKRYDKGVNFGFGFNVYNCYIGGSYDLSVGHEHRNSNHCYMIDLGYSF